MRKLLNSSNTNIVKEAAWLISNITAGNPTQIQAVIELGIFEDICHVLKNGEWRSQKQAAWVITNVTSKGTTEQITYMIENDVFKPYCDLLESKDASTVLVSLNGLKNLANKLDYWEKFTTVICGYYLTFLS